MSRRQSFELPGIKHGAPIPMGALVGSTFRSSGIMGRDAATNTLPEDGAKQVEFAFANARALLELAGVASDQVVFVEVLQTENGLREEVNKHWLAWFPDEHDRPARHTTVRELPHGLKIQLELLADVGGSE